MALKESDSMWTLKPLENRTLYDKKMTEKGAGDLSDPSFLFSNLITSFCKFCVSSFLFFSFLFSELFTWLFNVLSVLSERSTTVLEALDKQPISKKEAPKASKVEPVKAIQWTGEAKAADKKEGANPAEKKEVAKPAEKKEAGKEAPKASEKKVEKVVMKVPICCGGCADSVRVRLGSMRGVTSVECDVPRQKVTVVTSKATPADILAECVRLFKHSRMWRDDD